ncbi:hypothetical protein JNM87_02820 [Candidatus Saccharibacteria bacterium]|nr:hypothetical protein [Candidatus Saccharibacteria bacterium]
MAYFPDKFVEKPEPLERAIGDKGDLALARLENRGFTVATGLTRYFAGAIGIMAQQQHIIEFCPKDATAERFMTEATTERFLASKGGLAMFLLLSQVIENADALSGRLEGYAWAEYSPCDELPNNPIASIYRIGANAKGKGIAKDFVQTVVSATHTLFAPNEGIGLQVWRSNFAVRIYEEIGFTHQPSNNTQPQYRPTLDPNAENGLMQDTRLFMAYDPSLHD